MASVRIPDEDRTLRDPDAIRGYLKERGIEYERWSPVPAVGATGSSMRRGSFRSPCGISSEGPLNVISAKSSSAFFAQEDFVKGTFRAS